MLTGQIGAQGNLRTKQRGFLCVNCFAHVVMLLLVRSAQKGSSSARLGAVIHNQHYTMQPIKNQYLLRNIYASFFTFQGGEKRGLFRVFQSLNIVNVGVFLHLDAVGNFHAQYGKDVATFGN